MFLFYFRTAGEIIVVSLAQGGPAPCFMQEWCFTYLATGDLDQLALSLDDVTDQEPSQLISKVRLKECTVEFVCVWGAVLFLIPLYIYIYIYICVRAIILHSTVRLTAMLQQVRKGLQLYNFLDIMEQYPDLCHSLFMLGEDDKPDVDFIMMNCVPQLSEKGSTRHTLEIDFLNYFQDFLQKVEHPG
ncbi:hypothetical protein AOXY_G30077 [Acipenser oxyrinchus oxyrinchus]|uniref:Uncharacterized protein n=1 Tax=Acipenser oxyrinchus oxyrinchus TaxID=40147 RepID=A0AAD8CPA0_ACIOX|nr:hypothetical protein AOXY_G30077 [Acipenser oxyrinchus oxyrinchus]